MPLQTFVAEEIWGRLGVEHDAFFITDLAYAPIATGGFNTTLRDAARFGLAVLHGGRVGDRQVLAADWVEQSFQVQESDREAARRSIFLDPENPAYFSALEAYRNFWWVLDSKRGVILAQGVFGQFIYINRAADLVVAGFASPAAISNVRRPSFHRKLAAVEAIASHLVAQKP